MVRARDVLQPGNYSTYRNVRAVLFLIVFVDSCLFIGGIIAILNPTEKDDFEIGIFLSILGLVGVVGGIAGLLGRRKVVPLLYVLTVMHMCMLPLGIIMALVLFTGLSDYFMSVEQIRDAEKNPHRLTW
ncbi:MAG: hypothetical protein R3B84_19400 [Zavarzinella sp.]